MDTYDRKHIRLSVITPLGNAFFSEFNKETLHKIIQDTIRSRTGYMIDKQNDGDLQSLMRVVYTDMAKDPYTNVKDQVARMNQEVVARATSTISTGMLQQLVYMHDISINPIPLEIPVSTSTYGNKIPSNYKFGIY
jgi:hypothetical protein